MDKECPSDRLVNEVIVYLVAITLLLVSHWMTVVLSNYRWFQRLFFRIPGNHFGPMNSFCMGLFFWHRICTCQSDDSIPKTSSVQRNNFASSLLKSSTKTLIAMRRYDARSGCRTKKRYL